MTTGKATATIGGVPHTYDLTVPSGCAESASEECLVFIHGWLLSRAYWQPLVSGLSDRHRCLTYDLRGFGDSAQGLDACSSSAYSLAAYAQDLGTLLDQMNLDQVWLLGHSLGGSIALWAAYLRPDRVKGVLCINAGGGIYIPREFEKFRTAG
ncbi:MAG: alpha/beta hydrolase, partial [Phormidesmis sp.]